MWTRPAALVLALGLLGLAPAALRSRAVAQGWVEPLSRLSPAPFKLEDARAPLAERIAWAQTLGEYGPRREAVAALLAALRAEPPPPLLDALVLALARRASPAATTALGLLWSAEERQGSSEAQAFALAAIGTPQALSLLTASLERPEARRGVQRAGRRAEAALLAALDGPQVAYAAALLGELGGPAAVTRLRSLVASGRGAERVAAAKALGELRARAAAPALLSLLRHPGASLRAAAAQALPQVVTPAHFAALAAAYARSASQQRVALLRALWASDPVRALPAVERALDAPPQGLQAVARELLLSGTAEPLHARAHAVRSRPPVAAARLLESMARTGPQAAAATSALARLPRGAGIAPLLRLRSHAGLLPHVTRSLAVALRSSDQADDDLRRRARKVLAALPDGPRAWVLRALAHDKTVVPRLRASIAAAQPRERAAAALATELMGDAALVPALVAQLAVESDAEAFRRQASAALALKATVPFSELRARFDDAAVAPEALRLAAQGAPRPAGEALRRALRAALSSTRPSRVRVAAALGLGGIADAAALPALHATLRDPSPRVRLAAARALSVLGGEQAGRWLRQHARVERNEQVRRTARLDPPPPVLEPTGSEVLELRFTAAPGARDELERPVTVELWLDDGRWLRIQPLSSGELLLADLPPGSAELRVHK